MANVRHLESTVQKVVTDIIRNDVKDGLGFLTVTGVKITNELSYMYVFYSVLGSEDDLKNSQDALNRANGYIKNQIAHRVKMRKVPELIFKLDESYEKGKGIDDLIKSIK